MLKKIVTSFNNGELAVNDRIKKFSPKKLLLIPNDNFFNIPEEQRLLIYSTNEKYRRSKRDRNCIYVKNSEFKKKVLNGEFFLVNSLHDIKGDFYQGVSIKDYMDLSKKLKHIYLVGF